jgi:3-oxoacyl-[acyl-carrier-protein] synthase III
MYSGIHSIEYYLPEKILDNKNISEEYKDWDSIKNEESTGVRERHIASENQTAYDLAVKACNKTLNNYEKNNIDFLIFCSQSPDYFLPTSACILQEELGLKTNTGALDINLGCSGYVYGLALAKGLISINAASNILLVTADVISKYIHPKDRVTRIVFGDGASATIIKCETTEKILEFSFGTDGKGMENLIVKNGGLRNKREKNPNEWNDSTVNFRSDNYLYMNGPELFKFTIKRVPSLIKDVLEKNKMKLNDVDYYIFHQANKFILEYLREKLDIQKDKFYNNLLLTGNTVSTSIPIGLKECLLNNKIKSGDKILLAGFGVGYSWGATIIEI